MKRILFIVLGIAAALALMTGSPASGAQVGASAPGNYVGLDSTNRVFPSPGHHLAVGQTETVQVTGTRPGQADAGALAVVVQLTSITPVTTGSLTVFTGAGNHGTPGNASVAFKKGEENSTTTTVGLTPQGTLKVTALHSATNYLLDLIGEYLPVASAGTGPQGPKGDTGATGATGAQGVTGPQGDPGTPGKDGVDGKDGQDAPAPTFGVASVLKDGVLQEIPFSTPLLGSPVGDTAAGFTRLTCKNVTDGCNISVTAYATKSGETIYPDMLLTKEDNTNGNKITCEYADGSDNNGARTALTGTAAAPTTVPLGIGSTADCGGMQPNFTGGQVTSINVPGTTGQGIHFDADVRFVFAPVAG